MNDFNLTNSQEILACQLMDLVLSKIYRKLHSSLSLKEQKEMERIFEEGEVEEKKNFFEKNLSNFEEIFKEELAQTTEELLKKIKETN